MLSNGTCTFSDLFAEPSRNGLTRPKAVRGSGVKMVNMGEIFAHGRLRNVAMERVPFDQSERSRFLLHGGDLLFARQSLVLSGAGKCSIFLGDDEPTTFESHVIRVRLNREMANPLYYYYYFQSHEGRSAIQSIVEQGAGASGIRATDLAGLDVACHPVAVQDAIAHALGQIDSKIELNRRMSATLDAMAGALFKSWFVDFELVRAKVEGRETGLPTEVADLFPDRLVDSESGEVPIGWDTGVLADAVEIHSGGTPRTSVNHYWNGDIPWYTPKDAPVPSDVFVVATEKTITQAGVENSSTIVLPAGTTVISARGTVGRLACLGVPMAMNQTCYGIRGAVAYQGHDYFIYWLIRSTVEELRSRTHGTVFDTITRQTFASVNVPLPPVSVVKEFEFAVSPLMGRILINLYQVGALTALRDTLLPELISGKLQLLGQQRPIMDDACPVAGGTLET